MEPGNEATQPAAPEAPVEQNASMPDATQGSEEQLPEDSSERTKEQFEKLREHNRQLKEELDGFKNKEPIEGDMFERLRPPFSQQQIPNTQAPFVQPQQYQQLEQQFVDENGNVDVRRLNEAIQVANTNAQQAVLRAQQAEQRALRAEESAQLKEVYQVFPQLNPVTDKGARSKDFDPAFFDVVRNRMLANRIEGRQETALQAAKAVSEYWKFPNQPDVEKVKQQAAAEAVDNFQKVEAQKRAEQPVEGGLGQKRNETNLDDVKLRELTKRGDDEAIRIRLQRSGN